jgi:hypothetical protein
MSYGADAEPHTIGLLLTGTFLIGFIAYGLAKIASYFDSASGNNADDDSDRAPTRPTEKS